MMPRYAAFLRGVTPMNAKMPALKTAFEAAGFTDVRTRLSVGNERLPAHPGLIPLSFRPTPQQLSNPGRI